MGKCIPDTQAKDRMRMIFNSEISELQQMDVSGKYLEKVAAMMFGVGYWLLNELELTGTDGLIQDEKTLELVKSVAPLALKSETKSLTRHKENSQKLLDLLTSDRYAYLTYLSFHRYDDEGYLDRFVHHRFFERDLLEMTLISMETILNLNREQILADEEMVSPAFRAWLVWYDGALQKKTKEANHLWFIWPQEEIFEKYRQRFFWQNIQIETLDWYSRLLARFVFTDYTECSGGDWLDRLMEKLAWYCEVEPQDGNSNGFLDRLWYKLNPVRWLWYKWHKHVVSPIIHFYYPSDLGKQL